MLKIKRDRMIYVSFSIFFVGRCSDIFVSCFMSNFKLLVCFIGFLVLQGCRKDEFGDYVNERLVLPEEVYNYEEYEYPQHFKDDPLLNLIMNFSDSVAISNEVATLGRVLFYDKKLSLNNGVSCGSCHLQELGFTDGVKFSKGFDGGLTSRNSMAIVNSSLQIRLFWDRRANTVEEQVLQPIQHPIEMGMNLEDLITRLYNVEYYGELFEEAFGDATITVDRVSVALGQFVRSIRSYTTKYDKGFPLGFSNFTSDELAGKELFFGGENACANCHFTQNIGGVSANVNGLDIVSNDKGVGSISEDERDNGRFKSVSLRNIMLTAPYMHDGRFETMDDVLDFYSKDIKPHAFLDDRLTTDFNEGGNPKQFNFTESEKRQFKAFLNTLTDWEMINDPRLSNPFVK